MVTTINFIKIQLISNIMEQENQLERKIKKSAWKEWIPIAGLYFVPRNIFKEKGFRPFGRKEIFNGIYHGVVSLLPIIYMVDEYLLARILNN